MESKDGCVSSPSPQISGRVRRNTVNSVTHPQAINYSHTLSGHTEVGGWREIGSVLWMDFWFFLCFVLEFCFFLFRTFYRSDPLSLSHTHTYALTLSHTLTLQGVTALSCWGDSLVSVSHDGTARLWGIKKKKHVCTYRVEGEAGEGRNRASLT